MIAIEYIKLMLTAKNIMNAEGLLSDLQLV